jgi:hypothetical protein
MLRVAGMSAAHIEAYMCRLLEGTLRLSIAPLGS